MSFELHVFIQIYVFFLNLHNHHRIEVAENSILLALFIIYNLVQNSAFFIINNLPKRNIFCSFLKFRITK